MPSTNSNTAHPISDERGRAIFDPTDLPGYGFGVIDIMGQGTWRVNAERINWAVFANAVRTLCGMCRRGAHGWCACGACGACVWCVWSVRVVRACGACCGSRARARVCVCVCVCVHAVVPL